MVGEWIAANTPQESTVYADPNGLAYWMGAISHREWHGRWAGPVPGKEKEWEITGCILGLLDCANEPPVSSLFNYYVVEYQAPGLRSLYSYEGVNVYEMVY